MVVILEISNPFQAKPGMFRNSIITRVWWGWFAVGILHVGFRSFVETAYKWTREE